MPSENWSDRAVWDRTTTLFSFEEAASRAPDDILEEITPTTMESKHVRCQIAIESLHALCTDLNPDIVVIVGNDQDELFHDSAIPAFAIHSGEKVVDEPRPLEELHPSSRIAEWAYHGTESVEMPGHPELAMHLTSELTRAGFDVTQLQRQPEGRSIGHAFTFVQRRLLRDRVVPIVPVMINTDRPPNIVTPKRCWEIGRALRRAIDGWEGDARILVVASGGLTHFEVDAAFDEGVLQAMRESDRETLMELPVERLVLGTSEVRNWIVVAGVLSEGYDMKILDYVAAYRSEAGTGCGMAFATWLPKGEHA